MGLNKTQLYNLLLVCVLLASVGTLIWGAILLLNGRDGGGYVRAGAGLTLISSIWIIVANLKKAEK